MTAARLAYDVKSRPSADRAVPTPSSAGQVSVSLLYVSATHSSQYDMLGLCICTILLVEQSRGCQQTLVTGMVFKMRPDISIGAYNGSVDSATKSSGQKHFWTSTWTNTIGMRHIQ